MINHPKMVLSSLASSKEAGGHLQSHQVPPSRLVHLSVLQLPRSSPQQLPRITGVKVSGGLAPKFWGFSLREASQLPPSYQTGWWGAEFGKPPGLLGSSQTHRSLPTHILIFQVPVQPSGETPRKPASKNFPCLWIWSSQPYGLPCGKLETYGFRQRLRLKGNWLGFHRDLKQTACFVPNWLPNFEISVLGTN